MITAWEVVRMSPAKSDYPVTYICKILKVKERNLIYECFGKEVYDQLKAAEQDYEYVEYKAGLTYGLGDVVLLSGQLYISTVANNTSNPTVGTWDVAKKFSSDCMNEAWECFIGPYLAFKIYNASLPYSTNQGTAKGLTKLGQDETGFVGSPYKEFVETRRQLDYDANEFLLGWKEWIEENPTCFNIVKNACEDSKDCLNDGEKGRRRIYLRI